MKTLVARLLLATGIFLPTFALAQPRHSDTAPTPSVSSPEDAATHLANFRHSRLNGDFCVLFEIIHAPRRGAETKYTGTAWGTWNDQGALTRFQIRPAAAPASGNQTASRAGTWEWLVQNGPAPRVWVLAPGAAAAREVPPTEWRQPLFPGVVYTPFDLLMPFVFWPDYQYAGPARVLDRAVDVYAMSPPKSDTGAVPVKIYLDREFSILVRAEYLDAQGKAARTLDLGSFQNVQDEWLPKSFDLVDEVQRGNDEFIIRAAALHQKLDAATFEPTELATPAAAPPVAAWTKL